MIAVVAGAAAMAETVMAEDEMLLHNLIPVGKNLTAMVGVRNMRVKTIVWSGNVF